MRGQLKQRGGRWAPLLAACLGLLGPGAAEAADQAGTEVDCSTLPNPVYFPATTLLETLLSKLAPRLADPAVMGNDALTLVHFPLSSCIAYEFQRTGAPLSGSAIYYTADGIQHSCSLSAEQGIPSDLSAMDVGGRTCLDGQEPPASLREVASHVETLGFVVPRNSSQTAITATEAYYIMKFAGMPGHEVAPWTDPNRVHVRHAGSSTQLTIGANIGISGAQWSGVLRSFQGSGDLRDALVAENSTGAAESSLGILNSSKWEAASDQLRVLAFQPFDQCLGAVFPDSTSTARDKQNVRDGHYPIWTNLRYILHDNGQGATTSPNGPAAAARVQRFVDLLTGVASLPGLGVSQAVIETGNIPTCAMHVTRAYDGGPLQSFEHPAPCDCYFAAQNGNPGACATCTADVDCQQSGGGVCRLGYCEPR